MKVADDDRTSFEFPSFCDGLSLPFSLFFGSVVDVPFAPPLLVFVFVLVLVLVFGFAGGNGDGDGDGIGGGTLSFFCVPMAAFAARFFVTFCCFLAAGANFGDEVGEIGIGIGTAGEIETEAVAAAAAAIAVPIGFGFDDVATGIVVAVAPTGTGDDDPLAIEEVLVLLSWLWALSPSRFNNLSVTGAFRTGRCCCCCC